MMKSFYKTKPSLFAFFLALFILLHSVQVTYAQNVSPVIMAQINAELKSRGLTETEVRTRLLKEGIDLEKVPPSEVPAYQGRVMAILDKMEAEKKGSAVNSGTAQITTEPIISKPIVIETKEAVTQPKTTKEEAVAEAAQRVITADVKKEGGAKIYGHSLFIDQSLEVFRTTDGAQAPDSYILGAGDEIRISIFGASQTDMQFKINSEGYIQPSGMSKIFLQGISLKQARELLYKRLSVSYTFRADQFALSIATARTIMVNIFGETKITGGFTLSALNSAFNALTAAGGPTDIGTVRNIQLIRGNKRNTMDLYEFMNDPTIQYKFDLQQNDIIYVPVVQNLVSIEGAVKRPMRYELLPKENLNDLIKYAGGLNVDAYPDFVQIQRYTDGEIRLHEYKLFDVISNKTTVPLQNGDIIRIKSIEKPIQQYVEISGSVYYPGNYDLQANASLGKLLSNAKPTIQAKTDLIFVERIRPDETVEVLNIEWDDLSMKGKDFNLKAKDRIKVPTLASFRDQETITVSGNVRMPFEKMFALSDRITVKQALELAGGLKTSAYPIAYVFRNDLFSPGKTEYIQIRLEEADSFVLQAGDRLNVYDNSLFTNIGEVSVFGAVKNPGKFTFDPSLSLHDLLTSSGGFVVGAAQNRVEVFRTVLSPTESARLEVITIEVDSNYHLVRPINFSLQPYDQVVVRMTPDFTLGRLVQITGQVNYPGTYVLESKQVYLSDLIEMAGGLLKGADARGSKLFRTYNNRGNITMDIQKALNHAKVKKHDPILFEGDVINIERKENTIAIRPTGTRLAENGITGIDGELNVVFQGNKSARWYIKNYAGGFAKEANKNSVTVLLKSGQVKSTKTPFYVFRNYPEVETGSMINMQMKPTKVEKETKREKTSWGEILSAITTALTVLVLAKQL